MRKNQGTVQNKHAGNAALADADVRRIRQGVRSGEVSKRELAEWYGVSLSTIDKIVNGRTYGWVPDMPPMTESELDKAAAASQAKLIESLQAEGLFKQEENADAK